MPKNKTEYSSEIFPECANYKSLGVGVILLSPDFRIIYKNHCSEKYLRLPRKGADLVKAIFDKESRKKARALPQKRGSFCLVRFHYNQPSSHGLLVRLHGGNFAVILHTSISVSDILGAKYSDEALYTISSCVASLYERTPSDNDIANGENPFKVNSDYLAEKHTVMRLLPLADGALLIKRALEDMSFKLPTEISVSDSIMTPYKFIDVALLTYASSELLATSRIYSQGSPVKLEIDISGCMATVKASGHMNISSDIGDKLFENGSTNLRLMMVSGAFASMGVDLIPRFTHGRFELTAVIPLADKTFDTFRLSTVFAKKFFVLRIVKQVFFADEEQ